jgi:hypothetical protein
MTENDIVKQLSEITSESDLTDNVDELVETWISAQVGVETVKPILMFMEKHKDWDFGMPGSLVHFVEKFYRKGYEQALVESIERYPTSHTVWMLNRIINGEKDFVKKMGYLNILLTAKNNKSIDFDTLDAINSFLELHSTK